MAGIWSLKAVTSSSSEVPTKEDGDAAPDAIAANVGEQSVSPVEAPPAVRPPLQRDAPQPPPLHQPPPPPASQIGNPNDSLSLIQLKKIVSDFPQVETTAYAFTYDDAASFEEEIDEWFTYNEIEFTRLRRAQSTFLRRWKKLSDSPWTEAITELQVKFVHKQITGLHSQDLRRRCKSLQSILYIVLGVWEEAAGKTDSHDGESVKPRTTATSSHVQQMVKGVALIGNCDAVPVLYDILRHAFDIFWSDSYRDSRITEDEVPLLHDELDHVMTIMYLLIEGARNFPKELEDLRNILVTLTPKLTTYLMTLNAKLRWDDANELPQTRIFLLFWKSFLLSFGGIKELNEVKQATTETTQLESSKSDLITASPLDYNMFRQEITSKYPAYVPPPSLIPLNAENSSILPQLPNHPTRNNGSNGILPPLEGSQSGGGSILNQPVHIATPVPSPPPSPAVAGKAGKKQNYQTNQNFPFMYPPLDSTSSSAGGKGACSHPLVGRKWEGSDVPASILEAGALFAKRMRMTRAMRQLWDERERFMKFERGWEESDEELEEDIEELDLEEVLAKRLNLGDTNHSSKNWADYGPRPNFSPKVKQKLDDMENFYREALPHLQSLVIVLLKAILVNVTALLTQPSSMLQTSSSSFQLNNMVGQRRQQDGSGILDVSDLAPAELEALRSREITAKAVSGILLLLLKWFKISHVLKFEYLSQLLLDSNYLPLILKLFAHQDVDKIVPCQADRDSLSFFTFCNMSSKNYQPPKENTPESEDDAIPPPIKLRREAPASEAQDEEKLPTDSFQDDHHVGSGRPEVDELGYPINQIPAEPVTDYSWRNFFSTINFLRVMQKICKNKAHRNLLLVQYKSSNILKKALKIPQTELRLYTLKLFKNQVPYCGRKWRQSNMRVITAVYLHCRPELRDEWLAGSDVDAEVEESLPLEQALRALTHWHNIKRYPDQMGADVKLLEEEHDFFIRELEKMDVFFDDGMEESSVWDSSASQSGWY